MHVARKLYFQFQHLIKFSNLSLKIQIESWKIERSKHYEKAI